MARFSFDMARVLLTFLLILFIERCLVFSTTLVPTITISATSISSTLPNSTSYSIPIVFTTTTFGPFCTGCVIHVPVTVVVGDGSTDLPTTGLSISMGQFSMFDDGGIIGGGEETSIPGIPATATNVSYIVFPSYTIRTLVPIGSELCSTSSGFIVTSSSAELYYLNSYATPSPSLFDQFLYAEELFASNSVNLRQISAACKSLDTIVASSSSQPLVSLIPLSSSSTLATVTSSSPGATSSTPEVTAIATTSDLGLSMSTKLGLGIGLGLGLTLAILAAILLVLRYRARRKGPVMVQRHEQSEINTSPFRFSKIIHPGDGRVVSEVNGSTVPEVDGDGSFQQPIEIDRGR